MTTHRGNRLTEVLAAGWKRLLSALIPAGALGAGLVMAFFPTFGAGFARLQTDLGDTRLNAYLLEHGWLWLTGAPGIRLWHPAFYYPTPDTLAFSDLMLSFGPLFWPWRALGCDVVLGLQLWMISVAACNFLVCYVFLRRRAGFDRPGSALGSFVISFAASRIAQLGHQQLVPVFFVIGALWAVWSLAAAADAGAERGRPWAVAALFGCLVAQLYGGYYNFVFVLAVLVVAGVSALTAAASRRVFADLIRCNWRAFAAASCGAVVLALPAVSHYLEAAAMAGPRRPRAALDMLPRLASYLFVSDRSWWYGWMTDLPSIHDLPVRPEHAVGLGLITTGCLLWVAWKTQVRPAVRLTITIVLGLGALVTMFPAGIHLWRFHVPRVPTPPGNPGGLPHRDAAGDSRRDRDRLDGQPPRPRFPRSGRHHSGPSRVSRAGCHHTLGRCGGSRSSSAGDRGACRSDGRGFSRPSEGRRRPVGLAPARRDVGPTVHGCADGQRFQRDHPARLGFRGFQAPPGG